MATFSFEFKNGLLQVMLESPVPINAWDGSVILPSPQTVTIMPHGSRQIFWQENPSQKENEILFRGGTPQAFKEKQILFSFVPQQGTYTLQFSKNTKAYLSDGYGTEAQTILNDLPIIAVDAPKITFDKKSPDHFKIQIYSDKELFGNYPVAIFMSEDYSGIHHYEARENGPAGFTEWHIAESPYIINKEVISLDIKAVDPFGNSRIESIRITSQKDYILVFLIIFCGIISLSYFALRKSWLVSKTKH